MPPLRSLSRRACRVTFPDLSLPTKLSLLRYRCFASDSSNEQPFVSAQLTRPPYHGFPCSTAVCDLFPFFVPHLLSGFSSPSSNLLTTAWRNRKCGTVTRHSLSSLDSPRPDSSSLLAITIHQQRTKSETSTQTQIEITTSLAVYCRSISS